MSTNCKLPGCRVIFDPCGSEKKQRSHTDPVERGGYFLFFLVAAVVTDPPFRLTPAVPTHMSKNTANPECHTLVMVVLL